MIWKAQKSCSKYIYIYILGPIELNDIVLGFYIYIHESLLRADKVQVVLDRTFLNFALTSFGY